MQSLFLSRILLLTSLITLLNLAIVSAGNPVLNALLSHKHLKIELHNKIADVVPSPTSLTTYLVNSVKISCTLLSIGYSNAIDLTIVYPSLV